MINFKRNAVAKLSVVFLIVSIVFCAFSSDKNLFASESDMQNNASGGIFSNPSGPRTEIAFGSRGVLGFLQTGIFEKENISVLPQNLRKKSGVLVSSEQLLQQLFHVPDQYYLSPNKPAFDSCPVYLFCLNLRI
jgi:hypothetical protein